MKIVHIVPGFGGTFYCGNCLRDSGVVASLKQAGHDAITLPMYLPLTVNGHMDADGRPVFYGAVNIYLKQYSAFRHMPKWMENLMNSEPVLKFAAKKSNSTRASGLEDLTESMLRGEEGHQSEELQQLVDFLKNHEKPDVVHVSNVLLLGLAKKIRDEVGVPVVYSLQDEDVWVDAMHENRREQMWQLLAEKAKDATAFIGVSEYFASLMQQKLNIPAEKLHIVHVGVNPGSYHYLSPATKSPAIGYVSRMCEENGFEVLVDAFILLKKDPAFASLELKATGGMTADDAKFIHRQMDKLKEAGLSDSFTIRHDFDQSALQSFFDEISVMSVPVLKGEAFGLYQLEAMASGVPMVQPALGAFPEILSTSGGGITYQPNSPAALAGKLAELLKDKDQMESLSMAGRKSVETHFNCGILSGKLVDIYKSLIDSKSA